ncbi:hypothetical protein CR513_39992, partial [Mucuna pruriens]
MLEDKLEAAKIRRRASRYLIEAETLYKQGFSMPLLKCLTKSQVAYVMDEIHRGICGFHSGGQMMMSRNLVCKYGLPYSVVSDIGRQFISNYLREFYEGLGINHQVTSVEHPRTNGQAKATNKVILGKLRKGWAEQRDYELNNCQTSFGISLWSANYHNETPFRLVFGMDAMIPVEVGEPSIRRSNLNTKGNDDAIRVDLDLVEEVREQASIKQEACKNKGQ